MGKKYIVELGRCERLYKAFVDGTGKPELAWLSPEVDLTPYTEPDLEQVRKEAYEKGYKKCMSENDFDSPCISCDEYERGLNDAWEAAKKIALMDTETSENVTGYFGLFNIMNNLTASEAIAKIKEYEDGKQEYHVGDEFENGAGQKFVVLKMDGKEIDRYIDRYGRTYVMKEKYGVMRKTGRHFPEIATVLEKMRGEQE